ncbi:beta-lactamase domain-containing protein 2-like [Saccoglossus kowalevskii]|uniref:Beta-lactamase domain-containing protein 2-like n=1 Tax=Saccoglossus kowalevskii TaxID=10224 RepID=A0ABM0GP81_SACKO|nr:PREDICTED: beta-lactamase domain-containing protein 2-like [Saccoglossus kowalevskii]
MNEGLEAGSAFAVYYKGQKVVDLWGGYANCEAEEPWEEETMTMVYSCTKGVSAICIAVAVERGYLDYAQKVSHYWPEFAQNGKENITVKQLVNHEAGLPVLSQPVTIEILRDRELLLKVLAESVPLWEPGTTHGYHVISYGWLLSGLLQHADPKRRTIGQFFREEIAKPFVVCRIDCVCMWTLISSVMCILCSQEEVFNSYRYQSLESPGAGGIGTARGLAKLFGIIANRGEWNGKRLLSNDLVKKFTECNEERLDEVIHIKSSFSYGMYPHAEVKGGIPFSLDRIFGHNGHGGQGSFFDADHNLSFAYVTSKLSSFGHGGDERYMALVKSTYDCLKQMETK